MSQWHDLGQEALKGASEFQVVCNGKFWRDHSDYFCTVVQVFRWQRDLWLDYLKDGKKLLQTLLWAIFE